MGRLNFDVEYKTPVVSRIHVQHASMFNAQAKSTVEYKFGIHPNLCAAVINGDKGDLLPIC